MPSLKLSDAQLAEWDARYRSAAAPYIHDEIVALGPFQRAGQSFLLIPLIGQLGAIFYLLYQAFNKKRAAGLPANFLLAVTPTEVHALKYRVGRNSVTVKGEVAVWKRSDLSVSDIVEGPMTNKLTLAVTESGAPSKLVCSYSSLGQNPWSAGVVEALRARSTAAAA